MKPGHCTDQSGNCDEERCYCKNPIGEASAKNALEQAADIIYNKREERNYGSFSESMEKTAAMASLMIGKEIEATDVYKILIAMKMTRESNAHKDDNIIDAIGYLAGLYDYCNERKRGEL